MSDCKRCGRTTRDDAYGCEDCADKLTQALSEMQWLTDEIDTTLTGRKGIDYRRGGTPNGTEPRLPVHMAASELLSDIRGTLVAWVKFCADEDIRNQSPNAGLPVDNIPAMARWLMWRVDGLMLSELGAEAVDEITRLSERGTRLVDRPADKWYAGPCNATEDCATELYAKTKAGNISCPGCGSTYDIAQRRSFLLESAEDVLADATVLAGAVSWLGGTPVTAARIWKWKERGRIIPHGHDGKRPLYRVGDVLDVLAATEKVS